MPAREFSIWYFKKTFELLVKTALPTVGSSTCSSERARGRPSVTPSAQPGDPTAWLGVWPHCFSSPPPLRAPWLCYANWFPGLGTKSKSSSAASLCLGSVPPWLPAETDQNGHGMAVVPKFALRNPWGFSRPSASASPMVSGQTLPRSSLLPGRSRVVLQQPMCPARGRLHPQSSSTILEECLDQWSSFRTHLQQYFSITFYWV